MKRILIVAMAAALFTGCAKQETISDTAKAEGLKPAKANPVVVMVDIERIVKESTYSKALQEDLKNWAEQTDAKIKEKVVTYRASRAVHSKSPRQLKALEEEINQLQKEARSEYNKRQNEAGKKMKERFEPLIQKLAQENGWDVVLNKSDQVTVWASDALDETDYIIHKLDQKEIAQPKAEGEKKDPAAE